MAAICGELIGEINYGLELTFEQTSEMESALQERLERELADFNPASIEIRATGDELVFICSVDLCQVEDLRELCATLGSVLVPGAKGRVLLIEHKFGPVTGWIFTSHVCEEIEVLAQV